MGESSESPRWLRVLDAIAPVLGPIMTVTVIASIPFVVVEIVALLPFMDGEPLIYAALGMALTITLFRPDPL